jgi:flagellar biosynthetic protein FliR
MEFVPIQIWTMGLVFARLGAIFMLAPAIGDSSVPPRVRLLLALFVAAIITPLVAGKLPPLPDTNAGLFLGIGAEILIGLAIGTVLRTIFSALATAGAIAGMQTGLSFAMTMDPTQGSQGAIFGAFLAVIGTTLVMQTNLHHWFIVGTINSFDFMSSNPQSALWAFKAGPSATWILASFSKAFLLAIQITAPLILYGVIFNVAIGIINRAAPAIQVFFIAQPIQVVIGLFLFMVTAGAGMLIWLEAMTKVAQDMG